MNATAKSVKFFGIYLYFVGISLVVAPNIILSLLQIPVTNEVWIRVVGVLTFCIGYYYHFAGRKNITAFFPITIPTRIIVFVSFTTFVILGYASPVLILFGAVDLIGAIWTLVSSRE